MKQKHEQTVVAGTAILAVAFLFIMTATEGKYWGPSEMDEYIITITEGEGQSYLDAETPTGMVSKGVTTTFLKRDCMERGTCYPTERCKTVDQGYVINKGHKVAKASVMVCP